MTVLTLTVPGMAKQVYARWHSAGWRDCRGASAMALGATLGFLMTVRSGSSSPDPRAGAIADNLVITAAFLNGDGDLWTAAFR